MSKVYRTVSEIESLLMITEEGKLQIARVVLNMEMSDEERGCFPDWTDHILWHDHNGKIWAKTDECGKYVERLKRLQVFL